ncbi:MAG: LamG domain-containing protein, partial [Ignavibacteria bacterium]|nr:LamG domain-containing protein [Ignavibacteria bacterium]
MNSIEKNIIKSVLLYFFLVCVSYSQTGETDVYGSNQLNGVLAGLSSPGRYAAVPPNFILNLGLQGTVEAWVYLTSYNEASTCIYEKGSSFRLGIHNSSNANKPYIFMNTSVFIPAPSSAVPLNRWVHLAATWQQTGSQTTVSFFMDGALVGSPVTQTVNVANNNDSVTIGGSRITNNVQVNGFLDEVRYWNRLRTGAEIARNRFCGIGDGIIANQNSGLVSAEDYSGLVSSWTFNEEGVTIQDYISLRHGFTRGGATKSISNIPGQPIPYNLAAYFPGGANDYIRVPDNNIFDRTASGTIDGWINPASSGNHAIISKGSTFVTTTFSVFLDNINKLSVRIGGVDGVGPAIPLNLWSHFAVAWRFNAGLCTVKFYLNGNLYNTTVITTTMPVNSDPVLIGNWQALNTPFSGYMDEIRLWNRDLISDEIKAYMFASPKSGGQFFQNNLLASWSFEGNLNNLMPVSETNGTFNIGFLNLCRFSGYANENITAPITGQFIPHITAISRLDGNPYPGGYSIR